MSSCRFTRQRHDGLLRSALQRTNATTTTTTKYAITTHSHTLCLCLSSPLLSRLLSHSLTLLSSHLFFSSSAYAASQPPPPAYSPQPVYTQYPQPVQAQQIQQPTLSCPNCRQPLLTPPGVQQLRCPRCQCVFNVSVPTPAVYTASYQPHTVIVQQPTVIVDPYPVGYGYGGYGRGYGYGGGYSGGELALGVGGGLLGGLLLADALDGGFGGGGFW